MARQQYLLSKYYVPSTVLHTMIKTDCPHGAYNLARRVNVKHLLQV